MTKTLLLGLIIGLCIFCTSEAYASNLEAEFDQITDSLWIRPTTTIDKFMGVGRFEKVAKLADENDIYLRDQRVFIQAVCASFILGRYDNVQKICRKWLEVNRNASGSDVQFVNDFIVASKDEYQNNCSKKIKSDLRLFLIRSSGIPVYELDDNNKRRNDPTDALESTDLSNQAVILENQGKFAEAIASYRKALELSGKDHLLTARLALSEFTALMSQEPESTEARAAQFARINDDFKKSLELNREDWRTISDYAAVRYMQNLGEAKPFIEEALKAPGIPDTHLSALRDALGASIAVPLSEKVREDYGYKLPPVRRSTK